MWPCDSCTAHSSVLLMRDVGISAQAFLCSSLLSHASSNALISVAPRRGKAVDVELFRFGIVSADFKLYLKCVILVIHRI